MSANKRTFKTGEFIFREGEASKCLYIVQMGSVSVRRIKGTAYIELAKIGTGEVLGEVSFFDHRPRSATAVAITTVETLEIDFESLNKIYEEVPQYMKTIMVAVSSRLRRANDIIRKLKQDTVEDPVEGGQKVDAKDAKDAKDTKEAIEEEHDGKPVKKK